MAWLVESLPSNSAAQVRFPVGLGILMSILVAEYVSFALFYPVLWLAVALTFY